MVRCVLVKQYSELVIKKKNKWNIIQKQFDTRMAGDQF